LKLGQLGALIAVTIAISLPGVPVAQAAPVPSVPRGVVADGHSGSATVYWSAPASNGGSPVTGYQVRSGATVHNVGASARSNTFAHLHNGNRYHFRVRGRNAAGYGPWSARVYTHVGTAPRLFTCSGRSRYRPTTIQLACGDGNGYFDRVSWTHWAREYALGKARQWYNTCNPYCAAGNYKFYSVGVRLYAPKTRYGRLYYARIHVIGGAHPYRASTPAPHK
jgi:hypothetical protein